MDAASSLSTKLWKHFHPNPGSASDNAHTTKMNRLIFFKKILQEITTFQVNDTKYRLKETKIILKSKEQLFLQTILMAENDFYSVQLLLWAHIYYLGYSVHHVIRALTIVHRFITCNLLPFKDVI